MADSVMDAGCAVQAGSRWCASVSGLGLFDDGQSNAGLGVLSLGLALDDQFTTGVSLAGGSRGHGGDDVFDIGSSWFGGAWVAYSADKSTHLGWQAEAGIAYGKASTQIARGVGLDNVEVALGVADIDTLGANVKIGYGFSSGDWLLTPSVGFDVFHSKRSSYDEDAGIDFPASFSSLQTTSSTASLAISAGHSVGVRGRLELGGGAVVDLGYRASAIVATSTIPGLNSVSQKQTIDRYSVRPFVSASYTFQPTPNWTVKFGSTVERTEFEGGVQLSTVARVGVSF